jgi:hypothetical protein
MSRPIRHARSTGCTISYWLAVKQFIPHRNIDRVIAESRFRPGRVGPFIATLARLSREEIGQLSCEKNESTLTILSFMHEALFGKHPSGGPKWHFSKAKGPTGCVIESGAPKKSEEGT